MLQVTWRDHEFREEIRWLESEKVSGKDSGGKRKGGGFGSFWRYFGREKGRENGCWENDGLAGGFREKIVGEEGRGRGKVLLFVVVAEE